MLCGTCGQPLEARRRDQRWCSAACRHQGYARAQVEALGRHLAALEHLQEDPAIQQAPMDGGGAGAARTTALDTMSPR